MKRHKLLPYLFLIMTMLPLKSAGHTIAGPQPISDSAVQPVITLIANDVEAMVGQKFYYLSYVSAFDGIDGDITHKIKTTIPRDENDEGGYVRFKTSGRKYFIYTVVNSANQTSSKILPVTIKDNVAVDTCAPTIIGVKDQIVLTNEPINLLAGITAIDDVDGDVLSRVTITIDNALITNKTYTFTEEKEYLVTYFVYDLSGNWSELSARFTAFAEMPRGPEANESLDFARKANVIDGNNTYEISDETQITYRDSTAALRIAGKPTNTYIPLVFKAGDTLYNYHKSRETAYFEFYFYNPYKLVMQVRRLYNDKSDIATSDYFYLDQFLTITDLDDWYYAKIPVYTFTLSLASFAQFYGFGLYVRSDGGMAIDQYIVIDDLKIIGGVTGPDEVVEVGEPDGTKADETMDIAAETDDFAKKDFHINGGVVAVETSRTYNNSTEAVRISNLTQYATTSFKLINDDVYTDEDGERELEFFLFNPYDLNFKISIALNKTKNNNTEVNCYGSNVIDAGHGWIYMKVKLSALGTAGADGFNALRFKNVSNDMVTEMYFIIDGLRVI